MAVDILSTFPGWSTRFDIGWRKETSQTQGGVTRVKDLGPPLWRAEYASRLMRPNELDGWRAKLDALNDGEVVFEGYPMSRCYPILYPGPVWASQFPGYGGAAQLRSIGADGVSLSLEGLPAGYRLSIGDVIQVQRGNTDRRDVYRVVEEATADADGETAEFKVRPPLWPGLVVTDPASVRRPWCNMMIVPGSISTTADSRTGMGTVTFQAQEVRD